jgi:hypothetical protein
LNFIKNFIHSAYQIPGFHSNQKYVVIESDDWGCWRSRDSDLTNPLFKILPHIADNPYILYDTLETTNDLESLFNVLSSVNGIDGNPAVITANTILGNPNFRLIKESGFKEYHWINYFDDLDGMYDRSNLKKTLFSGINNKLYHPQLHGREHVHVVRWLNELRIGNDELLKAFDYKFFGIPLSKKIGNKNNLMAPLDGNSEIDREYQIKFLQDSMCLFETTFGFKSESFIAPSYIWNDLHEIELTKLGISGFQGVMYRYSSELDNVSLTRKYRFTGLKSDNQTVNLVRNVFFEPTLMPNVDIVNYCLSRISSSFLLRKPAIIGSHRINFMGGLSEKNRDNNLILLQRLLKEIVKKWPDVKFVSSGFLVNEIKNKF